MKRSNFMKRSIQEQRADNHKYYDVCAGDAKKGISKVNPVFTKKPYSDAK